MQSQVPESGGGDVMDAPTIERRIWFIRRLALCKVTGGQLVCIFWPLSPCRGQGKSHIFSNLILLSLGRVYLDNAGGCRCKFQCHKRKCFCGIHQEGCWGLSQKSVTCRSVISRIFKGYSSTVVLKYSQCLFSLHFFIIFQNQSGSTQIIAELNLCVEWRGEMLTNDGVC